MNAFLIPCRDLERLVWDRVGSSLLRPALIVAASFALGFAGDLLTDRHWSALWGCGAIVGSLLGAVPRLRAPARVVGAYAGTWVAFGFLRAMADGAGRAVASLEAVPRLETRLFGGKLPSAVLQGRMFDPDRLQ